MVIKYYEQKQRKEEEWQDKGAGDKGRDFVIFNNIFIEDQARKIFQTSTDFIKTRVPSIFKVPDRQVEQLSIAINQCRCSPKVISSVGKELKKLTQIFEGGNAPEKQR